MKKFWTEFKAFISRGNIMNLAIGVVVGGAFSAIVTALTNSIIRPFINWIISLITGGNGATAIYTFLTEPVYTDTGALDTASCIYIDWGAFLTAIIDFFIIAITIFTIMKLLMGAQGYIKKSVGALPTRAERKQLRKEGVNMKSTSEVIKATAELRERNKPAPKELPPTQEELLTQILVELKKQNEPKETKNEDVATIVDEKPIVEEKPKKTRKKKGDNA